MSWITVAGSGIAFGLARKSSTACTPPAAARFTTFSV
jgi:hypothetical protein